MAAAASLDELHRQETIAIMQYSEQIALFTEQCALKDDEVDGARDIMTNYKKHICMSAVSGRSGKPVQAKVGVGCSLQCVSS